MSLNIITVTLNMGMEGAWRWGTWSLGLGGHMAWASPHHMHSLHREVQLPGHLHCGPKQWAGRRGHLHRLHHEGWGCGGWWTHWAWGHAFAGMLGKGHWYWLGQRLSASPILLLTHFSSLPGEWHELWEHEQWWCGAGAERHCAQARVSLWAGFKSSVLLSLLFHLLFYNF